LNHPQSTRAANRAVLIAFTANVTQMHRHDPAFQDTEPDAYAQAALSLLPELLMETPDLRTLEAVKLLVSLPTTYLRPYRHSLCRMLPGHLHRPTRSASVSGTLAGNRGTNIVQFGRTQNQSVSGIPGSTPA
jgi:hypothetical protein